MTEVTLSDKGIALILLEQELRNNGLELTRWLRRRTEAEDRVLIVKLHRDQIEAAIQQIKESI